MNILGISAYYHDSAACLVQDGCIVAAAQEERFTRKKHDHRFPEHAIAYCLKEGKIARDKLDLVAFYDKPLLKFERILETYLAFAPRGFGSFSKAIPLWIKEKLWLKDSIATILGYGGKILFPEHHESHAASAFYPSPYDRAAFLTLDGVGEWATTSFGVGQENNIAFMGEQRFPHSLGMLYSAFTYYTGFKVNSGEYKVMGLAPYGEPKYVNLIYDHLLDLKHDGSFRLDMSYFNYCTGLTMTSERFHRLFGGPPRKPEAKLTQREMDLARSVQEVTEEIVLRIARHVRKVTGERRLCMAGGVALNCVANGKLLKAGTFDDLWIQPAAGDAGGALGAALIAWHQYLGKPRVVENTGLGVQGASYLGPEYGRNEILDFLKESAASYQECSDDDLVDHVSAYLADEKVIGWFQGRMEFGPRALGSRSIIGDARSKTMQATMNLKIKFRESFRPFAPTVLAERVTDYFDLDCPSPYMLLVADVKKERVRVMTKEEEGFFGIEKLNVVRSDIPAVTHVDYSARIQTAHQVEHGRYYELLKRFNDRTGCAVIINTSFNVRGEPIVCTPQDAYLCFMRTKMDYLVLGNFILEKNKQPELKNDSDWRSEFELD